MHEKKGVHLTYERYIAFKHAMALLNTTVPWESISSNTETLQNTGCPKKPKTIEITYC